MGTDNRKKILIVDDEAIIALSTAGVLKKNGYKPVAVHNGVTAVDMAVNDLSIDLILMDIDLGYGLSGPDAAKRILEERDIPIIFLTSHSEEKIVESVSEITRYGYVIKNSGDFVLLSSIEMAFELFDANRRVKETAASPGPESGIPDRGEKQYRELFNGMIDGFAIHEIVVDEWGNPVDYIFLDVNRAFEKFTGLKKDNITGRRVSDIIPDIEPFWIRKYGEVALTGEESSFENYSHDLGKWFRVNAYSPERGYFATVFEDITPQKESDRIIKEKDERYRRLFNSVVGYVYTVYIENDIPVRTVHGPGCEAITGYTPDDFVNDPDLWYRIIHPDDRELVLHFATDIIHERIFSPIDHRVLHRDGRTVWVRNTPVPHFGPDDELLEYDSVINNISGYKSAEKLMFESRELLLNIINTSPDLIYVKDRNLKIIICNDAYAAVLRKSRDDLTGKTDTENGLIEDYVKGNIDKGIEGIEGKELRALSGENVESNAEPFRINGRARYFDSVRVPMYHGGEIVSLLGISRDVTERMAADRERESIIDLMKIINSGEDLQGIIRTVLYFMKSWSKCEAVGIRLQEGDDFPYFQTEGFSEKFVMVENSLCDYDLNGKPLKDVSGEPRLDCMCGNVIRGRFDPGMPFFTDNGSFWTNCSSGLVESESGNNFMRGNRNRCSGTGFESIALIPLRTAGQTIGLIQMNDRRRGKFNDDLIRLFELFGNNIAIALSEMSVRRDLAASFEKYRTVADHTYAWELWIGPEGDIRYCSPSCEWITGYSSVEFTVEPVLLQKIVLDSVNSCSCHKAGIKNEIPAMNEAEFRIKTKGGDEKWIGHSCCPVYDDRGNFIGRRGSNRDITAEKESKLRVELALKEKEMLLGEVHHRIKNNMNTISGLLMLQAASIDNDSAVMALNDARSRVQSMMIIYDKLYRSDDYRRMSIKDYLEQFIDEIFLIYRSTANVSVRKNIENIEIDSRILFSIGIIVNELVTNAFKYAFNNGREGVLMIDVKKISGSVIISVADNGEGVPEHVAVARQGGFGLNLVSALTEQIEGRLEIKNSNGTVVELVFPG